MRAQVVLSEHVSPDGRILIDTPWLQEAKLLLQGEVVLTPAEVAEAMECARLHLKWVEEHGAKSRADDSKDDPVRNARLGYAGQIAFSSWARIPWKRTVTGFKLPDVGIYEIRTSARPDLKIKGAETGAGADADDQIVVSVRRMSTYSFRVVGWIRAGEGKRPEWKRDPGNRGMPAFWVPHAALRPLADLPR